MWETFGAGGKEEGCEDWWSTGPWSGQALALLLPSYTWIMGVRKLQPAWCIRCSSMRVNLWWAVRSTHQGPGSRGICPD